MSLYRRKGMRTWTMEFLFNGQRIRESTGVRSKTLASDIEKKRRRDLEEGTAGIRKRKLPRLFSVAAAEWLEAKKPKWRPNTLTGEQANLKHLFPEFGRTLVVDIEAKDITRYQRMRIAENAAPKTINNEVGTLRSILRRSGAWARIQPEVATLDPGEDIGKAISAAEEKAVIEACGKSRSRSLLPFIVLTLETGARKNTVRTLQWKNIDFDGRCLKIGRDKTSSGTGRIIPLNHRAMGTLTFWAEQFLDRKPDDFVFPSERYGLDGEEGYLSGRSLPYDVNPAVPMGSWKTAWKAALRLGGAILSGDPENFQAPSLAFRIHDLRVTAVTRMLNAGVLIAKVAKIVGWGQSTMIAMSKKYGQFSTEDLRSAVESISRPNEDFPESTHQYSPLSMERPPERKM
jgi:integrase